MRFTGGYAFLSNFYDVSQHGIYIDHVYHTVENAYQAAKSNDPEVHRRHFETCSARQAKRLGRSVALRPDWESVKIPLMLDFLRQKFAEPTLRLKLSAISWEIVEHNYWHDEFWGVCTCSGTGQNNLGKLLMQVREEIRS